MSPLWNEPIQWKDGYGRSKWQPVRSDGAVLVYLCAAFQCIVSWQLNGDYGPWLARWRWLAVIRGYIGTQQHIRRELQKVERVTREAAGE